MIPGYHDTTEFSHDQEKCRTQVGLEYCFCFAGYSQTGGVLGPSDSPNKGIEPKPALPMNPMEMNLVPDPSTPLRSIIRVGLNATREDPSPNRSPTMSTPPEQVAPQASLSSDNLPLGQPTRASVLSSQGRVFSGQFHPSMAHLATAH